MTHVAIEDFERLYRDDPDPWDFAGSEYEQRRYDLTAAALPRRRYRRGFEPACAIGELTRRLAARCSQLYASEPSPTALAKARRRCHDLDNVQLEPGELPDDWPSGTFDLVVLSELGYYFEVPELCVVRDQAVACLERRGTLIAVHWRGHSDAHVLKGDEVHDQLRRADGVVLVGAYEEANFRLDVWERS